MKISPYKRIVNACTDHSIELTEHCIYVSIGEKKFYLYQGSEHSKTFPCALSENPPSSIENSLGTPLGLHQVEQKIGQGAPLGMVFRGRVPTGKCYWECEDDIHNKVTTRILWLKGLQAGENSGPGCDTFNRYIYIHGTNQEAAFETAKSQGCVLLRNQDVLSVFEQVPEKSIVLIER